MAVVRLRIVRVTFSSCPIIFLPLPAQSQAASPPVLSLCLGSVLVFCFSRIHPNQGWRLVRVQRCMSEGSSEVLALIPLPPLQFQHISPRQPQHSLSPTNLDVISLEITSGFPSFLDSSAITLLLLLMIISPPQQQTFTMCRTLF